MAVPMGEGIIMIVDRRDFLRAGLGAGAALALSGPPVQEARPGQGREFELQESTIDSLQDGMRSGRWTSEAIVQQYLDRIEAIDRQGPAIRSVVELNPEALESARRLDEERKNKGPRGPLHGIPILIKDNIDTADRMRTTAGSLALIESIAKQDATVVARLRAAGAVILGKTNLSEWANFRSSRSTSGWSGRGGQTRNPYALDRNPCGSSSGSGAAAAADLCAAAIGTETDGSVVCPASTCGVVGIKPTVGLVSRAGIIPISHSQDTAGPMARTVRDAAILLGAMAGADPRDTTAPSRPADVAADYTAVLAAGDLRGTRIGVVRSFFGYNDRVDRLTEEAIDAVRQLGASLVDPAEMPNAAGYEQSEMEVLCYEFKAGINAYLATLDAKVPVRTLRDLIEFNERNKEREMAYFGQELFLQAEAKGPLSDRRYRDALRRNLRLSREDGLDAVMRKHRLDALMAPTGGPAWVTDLVNGDHFSGSCSTPAAVAGYPHITIPGGYVFGLPVGVSFFGRAYSESVLIKIAFAFEQATGHRRAPQFVATARLV